MPAIQTRRQVTSTVRMLSFAIARPPLPLVRPLHTRSAVSPPGERTGPPASAPGPAPRLRSRRDSTAIKFEPWWDGRLGGLGTWASLDHYHCRVLLVHCCSLTVSAGAPTSGS